MGNVIQFPRVPVPEAESTELTEREISHFADLRRAGHSEEQALEILVMSRRILNVSHGD